MNAPDPIQQAIEGDYRLLDTASLVPSKTNPRTRRGLDEASLNELAASIKAVGVAQPILVRPFPDGSFEIIAGERRWRASTIAGLPQVPVLLRNITDGEVLQIQLTENIQRADLDALEEAEGYDKLMQQKDGEGKLYTAERIAEIMGVSKGTIYARLKLLALCPEAREAFIKGELDASRGLLIARIPVHKLQVEALKEITKTDYYGNAMSYRRAAEFIHENFMLDLSKAGWKLKDAELLPKAGACTECTKRTGNQPGLFDDVKSKDVCTDPSCYAMKKTAYVLKLQKDAEAQGHKVMPAKEAKKILPNQWQHEESQLHQHGLAKLTECIPNDKNGTTWEKALNKQGLLKPQEDGKPAVQQIIIEHPHNKGEVIQAITIEQAAKMLRESGFDVTLRTERQQPAGPSKKEREEEEKLMHQLKVENTWRARLFDTLHQQLEADITSNTRPEIMPALFLMLVEHALTDIYDSDLQTRLLRLFCPEALKIEDEEEREQSFKDWLPHLTMQQHFMILLNIAMYENYETNKWAIKQGTAEAPILQRVAKIAGIDAAAMKEEIETELAAQAKAEPEKKKPGRKAKGEKA